MEFTDEEILQVVDYHAVLITSLDAKIREFGLKSFKNILKILHYHSPSDALTEKMDKYRQMEKLEMIWIVYIMGVISHH